MVSRGLWLREYAMGAVEALHWAVDILDESKGKKQAKREIEEAIRDLMRGVSVDFRERLRTGNR